MTLDDLDRRPVALLQVDALLDEMGAIDGVLKTTTAVVLARRIDRNAQPSRQALLKSG